MNRRTPVRTAFVLALCASMPVHAADFVYEGRLEDGGQPANGRYELSITPFADPRLGAPLAKALVFPAVEVVDGRFRLEFALDGVSADAAWLQLAVRAAGDAAAVELPGRTKAIAAPLIGACWSATGDSGSNPATNFLGTTDAQPLVLRTRNAQSLRIEPSMITFGSPALPITANVIGGSHANTVTAGVRGATIGGGGMPSGDSDPDYFGESPNSVTDHYGTVGGGFRNVAGNGAGTVVDRMGATVAGGYNNVASGGGSIIGGGTQNATEGGLAVIGGGQGNVASGGHSAVIGGSSNVASNSYAMVGGGELNAASGDRSAVGGGSHNAASGEKSTVGGGFGNRAGGTHATIPGGWENSASGFTSIVSGGFDNCAGGDFSWAGGYRAKVRPAANPGPADLACTGLPDYPGGSGDSGTFVWADSQTSDFVSSGSNRFLVRAQGGALITGGSSNSTEGNRLRVDGSLRVDVLGLAGATSVCRNSSNQIAACSSSARYKSDIEDLDLGLATMARLRPVTYRWIGSGQADLGFVAEDVALVDERLVTRNEAGDIEGVKYERLTAVLARAMTELQEREEASLARLEAEGARKDAEIEVLRSEIDELRVRQFAELAALHQQLAELRALLAPQVAAGGR
jgi:hypothetical protein